MREHSSWLRLPSLVLHHTICGFFDRNSLHADLFGAALTSPLMAEGVGKEHARVGEAAFSRFGLLGVSRDGDMTRSERLIEKSDEIIPG